MIAPLSGWTWEVEGGGVTLRLAEAPARATIRYRERVRPLRRAREIAEARAADLHDAELGPLRPTLTREGEHAVLISIDAVSAGRPARRTLGLVFTDDFYAECEGLALGRALFERVDEAVARLVRDDRLLLGTRRRRFVYRPPPGWFGYTPIPLHAHWFPPGYPDDGCMIVVYPALPRESGAETDPDTELEVLSTGPSSNLVISDTIAGPLPVETDRLAGHAWELACRDAGGRRWQRRVILLTDDRYAYPVFYDRADDRDDDDDELVAALLDSIQPIQAIRTPADTLGFAHWWL